jgi:hypothetical protein
VLDRGSAPDSVPLPNVLYARIENESCHARIPAGRKIMNARTLTTLQVAALTILWSPLVSSVAHAIEPEKQPIYSNITGGLMCGTRSNHPVPQAAIPCTVPAGQRLIIEHISGYAFAFSSTDTTLAASIVVTIPPLGVNEAAFHTFVATKTGTSGGTDVFTFSTPFRMMLPAGSSFYFSPADAVSVSGYLVKQ